MRPEDLVSVEQTCWAVSFEEMVFSSNLKLWELRRGAVLQGSSDDKPSHFDFSTTLFVFCKLETFNRLNIAFWLERGTRVCYKKSLYLNTSINMLLSFDSKLLRWDKMLRRIKIR